MKSRLFSVLLFIETAALLLTAGVSWYYHVNNGEDDYLCFLLPAAISAILGLILFLISKSKRSKPLETRDSYLVVTLAWVIFSLIGMFPFLLNGTVDNTADAFFETMSGFTATGSTILENIDGQPHGILFWRCLMQWLGGLGIVVFTLAFIPTVAKGSKKMMLFAAESSGLSVEKLSPRMQKTARNLWIIYFILTFLCGVCYYVGPMSLFDAVCHAMTTVATGGFSTHQASIGYFNSPYIEYVTSAFMILSGINFALYFFAFTRRFDVIRKNEELKVYLSFIVCAVALFCGLFYLAPHFDGVTQQQLAKMPHGAEQTFRTSLFHTATMLTSTGYQSSIFDYDQWGIMFLIPSAFFIMIGGCAGSTAGGVKMVRIIVIYKYIKNSVKEFIHPTGMFSIKLSDQKLDETAVKRVCTFFSLFILILVVNMIILPTTDLGFEESFVSFFSCFSNFGPGSGATGPSYSFASLPDAAKWLLSLDMLVGRLEIFTVLLLFTRSFWEKK